MSSPFGGASSTPCPAPRVGLGDGTTPTCRLQQRAPQRLTTARSHPGVLIDEELAHAKESLVRGFAQRFETMSQVASEIAELEGSDLSVEELERYADGVEAVTKVELKKAAERYLDTSEAIVVVVGDGEKVAEEVASIGFGPLKKLDADGELIT